MIVKEVDSHLSILRDSYSKNELSFLNIHEIQLWSASSKESTQFLQECREVLSETEAQRANFFEFEQAHHHYVMSQGGLKILLAYYLNKKPQEVRIGRHSKGKPYSMDDPTIFFNLSNSGDRIVYAFSKNGEVGIDLEQIRPLGDLDELIEKNFTVQERKYINHLSSERLQRFFKFWTVKESYLKAIGEGMRLTPDKLEFTIENGVFTLKEVQGFFEEKDWISAPLVIADDYVGTLTYLGTNSLASSLRFL